MLTSLYGAISSANLSTDKDEQRVIISVGRVVDTNDPMQMGRLRVYVAGLDNSVSQVRDIPFAIYCSPFAGTQQVQSRGPEDGVYSSGPVAFGMFSIPKVGTDVLIGHLNGDPSIRFWMGALNGILLTGTLPHGRFTFQNPNAPSGDLDGPLTSTEQPIQPIYDNMTTAFTRTDAVASNDTATDTTPRKNFEWRVRGADFQAAALGNIQKNLPSQVVSTIADDRAYTFTEEDGTKFHQGNFTQGYAQSRIEPNATYDPSLVDGGVNLDPQTYCWTTPGFSSMAMDDRPENARIRLRTGTGHQIILDDTNERIYISTVKGNNWIEMDQSGNVDIYAARRVSIHAAMDVNITTEQTFRVYAKEGIHMTSGGDIRMTAAGDTHIDTTGSTNIKSTGDIDMQSDAVINVKSGTNTNVSSGADTNIKSTNNSNFESNSDTNIKASGNVNVESNVTVNVKGQTLKLQSTQDIELLAGTTGSFTASTTLNILGELLLSLQGGSLIPTPGTGAIINLTAGPGFPSSTSVFVGNTDYSIGAPSPATPATPITTPAQPAQPADDTIAKEAYFTNRVPEHEPYGRIMMDKNATDNDSGNQFILELDYNSPQVGRIELGETIPRNSRWHR